MNLTALIVYPYHDIQTKRGYMVCLRKAFGDAANTQTYIVRAF